MTISYALMYITCLPLQSGRLKLRVLAPCPPVDRSIGFFIIKGAERKVKIQVSVAAMTALMVCMRFSASSNTMDWGLSNTSSVTSMAVRPYFS